jgi:peroxiredoxin
MSIAKPSADASGDQSASVQSSRDHSSASASDRSNLSLLFWSGAIVSVAMIPMFFALAFGARILITPWYLPIMGTAAALGVLYATSRSWRWWRVAIAIVCVALACFEWFLMSATRLPDYQGPLAAGGSLPAFHATLADGTPIDESYFRQNRKTAIVFFQGRWCPFCMTQLTELDSHHADFERAGAEVVVVSVEDLEKASQTKRDFPHLTVVSDKEQELSKAIDLINQAASPEGADIAAPTIILLDGAGQVRWLHRPERIIARPSAKELVAKIESW